MKINFLGIGSAWNINEDNTSAYIKKDSKMILIDCGESIARKIIKEDLLFDINELYILISHTHSDHIGSIGTLLFYSKYNKNIVNRIVVPKDEIFISNLKEYLRLVDISTEVEFVDEKFLKDKFDLINFSILKANHVKTLPCYCFLLEDNENLIYYSADNNNIEYIKEYMKYSKAQIYTEICDNPKLKDEHLLLQYLEDATSINERKKIYLMHINEVLDTIQLKQKGFNIPIIEKKEGKNIMEKKIKLNKQGYEDYLKEIAIKEKELADLRKYKGNDAIFQGDNWHDNPTLYQAELQEQALMKEISEMKYKLQNDVEIVENIGDDSFIDIGDVVKVDIILSTDNRKEEIFKLVATTPSIDMDAEFKEVSINSPVGNAMYHKKIGDVASYTVNDRTFTIELKEKVLFDLENDDKTLRKTR